MLTKFLLVNLEGRDHSEDQRLGWEDRMDLREIGWEFLDLIHLAQDRDQWRALMNAVMNFWVP